MISARSFLRGKAILMAAAGLSIAIPGRADIFKITLINVTFSASCIGGGATCSEVLNGSYLFDSVSGASFSPSGALTGSLNVTQFAIGQPPCVSPGCLSGNPGYDANALANHDPIEVDIQVNNLNAPTPEPLTLALLYVPAGCGGDQPNCGKVGDFPSNANVDFPITSGSYTSVDTAPEPAPVALLGLGTGALIAFRRRRSRSTV